MLPGRDCMKAKAQEFNFSGTFTNQASYTDVTEK